MVDSLNENDGRSSATESDASGMQNSADTADGPVSDHEAIADNALSINMADSTACYYRSGAQDVDEDTATSEYAEERGHSFN